MWHRRRDGVVGGQSGLALSPELRIPQRRIEFSVATAHLTTDSALLVDVRDQDEFDTGHIPGAINLPLNDIRQRLAELPRDREIWLYCGVGQRAYYATRLLMQNGFSVRNLAGGFRTYNLIAEVGGANQ